jgi:hypothetical protein
MLGVPTDFTAPSSPSCPSSLPDNQIISLTYFQNTSRIENKDGLKEGYHCLNKACDSLSKRSLHVTTMPGSGQPDTTLITDDEIPLSNYQHLYTSAFFSNNTPKPTNVVKTNDDTLLLSFINSGNNQQNQPHLAENTPTTLITSNLQHEICTKSVPHHENCEVLNLSDVTCDCTGQSPTTGFHELGDHNSINFVKVNPLFMARTNRLRKYHALQAQQNKLEYPHYDYTCENVRKLQQNDAHCNQIIRYIEQSILPNDVTQARKLLLTIHLYVLKDRVLYRLPLNRRKGNSQLNDSLRVCLVVPESLKFEVLSACHGDIYSGHFGIERTFARLQLKYFWNTMFEDTSNFVASCIVLF